MDRKPTFSPWFTFPHLGSLSRLYSQNRTQLLSLRNRSHKIENSAFLPPHNNAPATAKKWKKKKTKKKTKNTKNRTSCPRRRKGRNLGIHGIRIARTLFFTTHCLRIFLSLSLEDFSIPPSFSLPPAALCPIKKSRLCARVLLRWCRSQTRAPLYCARVRMLMYVRVSRWSAFHCAHEYQAGHDPFLPFFSLFFPLVQRSQSSLVSPRGGAFKRFAGGGFRDGGALSAPSLSPRPFNVSRGFESTRSCCYSPRIRMIRAKLLRVRELLFAGVWVRLICGKY